MKNLNYILFCFPLFFLAASCDDDDDFRPFGNDELGVFECKVNGETWRGQSAPVVTNGLDFALRVEYFPIPQTLKVRSYNNKKEESILFRVKKDQDGMFELFQGIHYPENSPCSRYDEIDLLKSSFELLSVDTIQQTISGRFLLYILHSSGGCPETFEITEGYFEGPYHTS